MLSWLPPRVDAIGPSEPVSGIDWWELLPSRAGDLAKETQGNQVGKKAYRHTPWALISDTQTSPFLQPYAR